MSREDHPNRPLPGGGPLRQARPGLTDAGLFTLLLIQVQERLLQEDAFADGGLSHRFSDGRTEVNVQKRKSEGSFLNTEH